ncbi:MAG: hypothetical protein QNK23_16395 [Crocinitomicaceae bacterium]|nr:hypothetical protein [Crocinitomicaceae bacterium]
MEDLKNQILHGVIRNGFEARRHVAIWNVIVKNVTTIKSFPEVHQNFFGHIQSLSGDTIILKTAHIYDPPSKRYVVRSLPAIIKRIESSSFELIKDLNEHHITKYLLTIPNSSHLIDDLNSKPSEFLTNFSSHLKSLINSPNYSDSIKEVKEIRDKYIAHNELVTKTINHDFKTIQSLTELALNSAIIIESCLFQTSEYFIDDDISRGTYFIRKTIDDLNTFNHSHK